MKNSKTKVLAVMSAVVFSAAAVRAYDYFEAMSGADWDELHGGGEAYMGAWVYFDTPNMLTYSDIGSWWNPSTVPVAELHSYYDGNEAWNASW